MQVYPPHLEGGPRHDVQHGGHSLSLSASQIAAGAIGSAVPAKQWLMLWPSHMPSALVDCRQRHNGMWVAGNESPGIECLLYVLALDHRLSLVTQKSACMHCSQSCLWSQKLANMSPCRLPMQRQYFHEQPYEAILFGTRAVNG